MKFNATDRIQEALRFNDSIKHFQDTLKFTAIDKFQEELNLINPMKEIQSTLKFNNPMESFQDTMALSAVDKFQDTLKFIDPMKGLHDVLEFNAVEKLKDTFKFEDPMERFQEIVKFCKMDRVQDILKFKNPMNEIQEAMKLVPHSEQFKEEAENLASFHDIGGRVISNIVDSQCNNLDQFFDKIKDVLESQSDPQIQKGLIRAVLLPIILFIISSITVSTIDYYVKGFLKKNEKHTICKQINKAVVESVDSRDLLKNFRYVKTNKDPLLVRMAPDRSTGRVLGKLYFGQIVEILDKQKKWVRIRWKDESGKLSIEGWVNRGYLKKFK